MGFRSSFKENVTLLLKTKFCVNLNKFRKIATGEIMEYFFYINSSKSQVLDKSFNFKTRFLCRDKVLRYKNEKCKKWFFIHQIYSGWGAATSCTFEKNWNNSQKKNTTQMKIVF